MNDSNNETDIQEDTADTISAKVRIYFLVGLILTILWTVLIIGLNLAVIVIIYRYKKRTRLYFFLFHLAIADLLTGFIHCLPHSIERSIGYDQVENVWLAGDIPCKLQWTLGHVSVVTSNYVLAFMSIDRAFAVCRPMKSIKKGYLAQKLSIIACWTFSLLVCSPYLSLIKTYPASRSKRPICISNYQTLYDYKVELILQLMFVFIIPLTIIAISYGSLLFAVHHRSDRLKEDQTQKLNRVFNGAIPKTKMKSIKLTIGIVLSLIVCWSAYNARQFMGVYGGIRHPIFLVMTTFYYLNSVANPILFFIYHRRKLYGRFIVSMAIWIASYTSGFIVCWSAHNAGQFMGVYGGIRHPIFLVTTTFYYLNSVANPILFFIYHRRKSFVSAKSSYSSHCVRKVEHSPYEHHSAGSRLSFMKDVYVEGST